MRVLVVDDQALFRAGIAMIIGTQPDLDLVAEVASGEEALRLAGDGSVIDVVLMDVSMPGMGGIKATAALTALPDAPRVLVLTTFDDAPTVTDAIAAGASGFVLKDARAELLLSAIRSVADGIAVVARSRTPHQPTLSASALPPSYQRLTASEQTVLRYVASGLSNREIAAAAFLSEATVKSYVSRILMKLELRDRVQLVLFATRHGLSE